MRRTLVRALALTLLLALTLDAGVALAQPLPITPGGTIVSSSASETCVNTAGECQMFQYTIPAAMTATFTNPLANVSQWLDGSTATGFHGPVLWTTPQPLHLKLIGTMANAANDNIGLGVNFGGAVGVQPLVATMYISNVLLQSSSGPRPAYLDVWIIPIASSSATPSGTSTVGQINYTMVARLEVSNFVGATPTIISSHTFSSSNLGSATQINVLWRWGAASNASSITWIRRILKLGE